MNHHQRMTIIRTGMGSKQNPLTGGLVLATRNGKTYLRRAPVRKKDSWTPAQQLHRQRFKKMNAYCRMFKYTVIPQIWNDAAQKMCGFTLFLKTNTPVFDPEGNVNDPRKLILSTGKLALFPELQVHRLPGENTVEVNWQHGPDWGGIFLREELMVVSAANDSYSDIMATGLLKGTLHGSFQLPPAPENPTRIYLFSASRDRRNYSASICFEI